MYFLYQLFTRLFEPLITLHLKRRVKIGKEAPKRLTERQGIASRKRPEGFLIWCHAASVGESKSLLAILNEILKKYPGVNVLVTTGTLTSAELMARELPKNCIHQFAPVDCARWVSRFLRHWQPDLALWLESELWPNMILQSEKYGLRKVLLNARISDKSYQRWQWGKGLLRRMIVSFDLVFAQTASDEKRFIGLGALNTTKIENLKYANRPLSANPDHVKIMQEKLRRRQIWVAASTHPGEEDMIAAVHQNLLDRFPRLLTIIIPRHPDRGDEIVTKLQGQHFNVRQRSKRQTIKKDTQIYVVDTLGELGLFFRLSEVVFLGGSLVPIGGHNLLEPAQLICAIIVGPYMDNQRQLYQDFKAAGGVVTVSSQNFLEKTVADLFDYSPQRKKIAKAASAQAMKHMHVLNDILRALRPYLPDREVL